MNGIKRTTVYKTTDGKQFENEDDAIRHQDMLLEPAFIKRYTENIDMHLVGDPSDNYWIPGEQILKWLQDNYGEFMEVLGLEENF